MQNVTVTKDKGANFKGVLKELLEGAGHDVLALEFTDGVNRRDLMVKLNSPHGATSHFVGTKWRPTMTANNLTFHIPDSISLGVNDDQVEYAGEPPPPMVA